MRMTSEQGIRKEVNGEREKEQPDQNLEPGFYFDL
jgi:hypothetical protein